ncbi:MAG: thioredoxin domain-containing protein [Ilumatobacteraceae bacterium]
MNRLSTESSPYLRQHAGDPIDWYPWCDEAFAEARARDVPVLVSVGYSSCHWCHVMAAETFADRAVGDSLRVGFVAIKVDREELPEVDAVLMEALVALTGRGGWPMTMILDPERRPFWGGTYYDRAAFVGLLDAVSRVWLERRSEVQANADTILEALRSSVVEPLDTVPGPELINVALSQLAQGFDGVNGGFGKAPKFANPMGLDLVMRAHMITPSQGTTDVITTSLDAMASGGIHDLIGGGFSRYSTDERWLVPHFEKMLYDQAMMIGLYRRGWSLFGHQTWRAVVEDTISHLLTTFRHPNGALCSSIDADSLDPRGQVAEGAYYTWTPDEFRSVLGSEADRMIEWYGITDEGHLDSRSVPNRLHARGDLLRPAGVEEARRQLLAARGRRPAPSIDDKVILEWNALSISALADAGMVMARPEWIEAAVEIADFLIGEMRDAQDRWLRVWHVDGEPRARHRAAATDLAALVDAFTRLGEATGRAHWTELAVRTADDLLDHHWDAGEGGLITTASDAPEPLIERKDVRDDTTPSANSLAAGALLRLSAIVSEPRYANHADRILQLIGAAVSRTPTAVSHGLAVLETRHRGITEVVIPGDERDLVATAMRVWRPDVVLAWGERTTADIWDGRENGLAYVCQNRTCSTPVDNSRDLLAQLTGRPVNLDASHPDA